MVGDGQGNFSLSFNCYICRNANHLNISPIQSVSNHDGTITLTFSDVLRTTCPHCGQRYAIPNAEQIKIIPERKSPRL